MKIVVINGPNLNLLGLREPNLYGRLTYKDLVARLEMKAEELNIELEIYQSNHEGDIVDYIQAAYPKASGILINPAAYTHTSIAILDALKAIDLPFIEVHLTDVMQRESYRKISYIREYAIQTISGKGIDGYLEGLEILVSKLKG